MVKRKYQDLEQENVPIAVGAPTKEEMVDNTGEATSRNPLSPHSGNRIDREEHEHDTSSTTKVVTKKAKGKGKSSKPNNKEPATRRRNSKAGILENIMAMPFDVVCEIAANLSPGDLLSMARTSKVLRDYFITKQSKPLWRAARQGVGLPECPADISEAKFADLIFLKGCYHCGARRADWLNFSCRLRLCKKCFFKSFSGRSSIKADLKLDDWFFSLLTASEYFGGCEYYNSDEAKEVQKQYQSLRLMPDEVTAFLAERMRLVSDTMLNTGLVKVWMKLQQQKKEDEKNATTYNRFCNILHRLLDSGFFYEDFEEIYDTKEMSTEWNKLLRVPKPLTDRIWNNIKPKLERIILNRRAIRREFMISRGHTSDCGCSDSEYFECVGEDSDCDCVYCVGFI